MNTHESAAKPNADKQHPVTVKVNGKDVNFADHKASGSTIKSTAIAQGIAMEQDFSLFEIVGNHMKPIEDTDEVTLHPNQAFRAVTADDNSIQ